MNMADKHDGQETLDGYGNTEPAPMFRTLQEMREFMQNQFPPSPKPKEIEHVVLDADDTIWEVEPWGSASLAHPIGHTEEDVLPVALNIDYVREPLEYWRDIVPTGHVKLAPKLRETLDKLKQKGIPVSIASINDKRMVLKYLDAFGLRDEFADVEAGVAGGKDEMVRNIAKRNNVDSAKILFVDDNPHHAIDVSTRTGATSLIFGYNIHAIEDILEFIE